LHELKNEIEGFGKAFKINLIGQVDQSVISDLETYGLKDNVQLIPHIPHDQVLQWQQSSQVLLLLVNNTPNAKGILTGKLFEYLASGRPILCIGPKDGDAAHVISDVGAGCTVGFDEKEKIKENVKTYYLRYLENNLPISIKPKAQNYCRRSLTKKYANILNNL
jgi:hypothetical protein